jgi:hypothetical protein
LNTVAPFRRIRVEPLYKNGFTVWSFTVIPFGLARK